MPAQPNTFDAYFLSLAPVRSGKERCLSTNRTQATTPVLQITAEKGDDWKQRGPGSQNIPKRCEVATNPDGVRQQTWRACERCRRLKLKCDHERPCAPCVRRGCGGTCVDWDRSRALSKKIQAGGGNDAWFPGGAAVHRPLPWRQATGTVRIEAPDHKVDLFGAERSGSSRAFLGAVLQNFGLSKESVQEFTTGLPTDLCDAVVDFIQLSSQRAPILQSAFSSGRKVSLDCDATQQLDIYPGTAYVKSKVDPDGGPSLVQINSGYCQMMNAHPEELITRLELNDFEHPFSDLDQLCSIVDSLDLADYAGSESCPQVFNRYFVMSRGFHRLGEPILTRVTCRISFDAAGRHDAIEKFVAPISPVEYDLYRDLTPHQCRPLAADVLGDARSGAELLAQYRADRAVRLSELARTPRGQAMMRRLTAHIRARCAFLRSNPPPSAAASLSPVSSAASAESPSQLSASSTAPRCDSLHLPSPPPAEAFAPHSREESEAGGESEGGAGEGGDGRGIWAAGEEEEGVLGAMAGANSAGLGLEEGDLELGLGGFGGGLELLAELWNADEAGLLEGKGEGSGDAGAWLEEAFFLGDEERWLEG